MSKRPLILHEGPPLMCKKARVARILLVPAPRVISGADPGQQVPLNVAEAGLLQEYGSLLPWLTSVDAKRRGVTDSFVDVLTSSALRLREVALSGNAALTDSSLMLLGFRCRHLRVLELQGCNAMTSQGLEYLVSSCRATLEVLDVRGCSLVDDAVVAAVAACANLRELYLSGTSVTPSGLRSIMAACANLEAVDLSGVTLDSADVQILIHSLKRLRSVDVSFCPGLRAEDVQRLFDANPSLTLKAFGVDLFGVRVPATATLVY